MRKIFSLIITLSILFTFISPANASYTLKNPQGRMGTSSYKTEKYTPVFKSNLTQQELSKINKIITEDYKSEKPKKNSFQEFKIRQQIRYAHKKQIIEQYRKSQALQKEKEKALKEQRKKLEKEKAEKNIQETKYSITDKLKAFKIKKQEQIVKKEKATETPKIQKVKKEKVEKAENPQKKQKIQWVKKDKTEQSQKDKKIKKEKTEKNNKFIQRIKNSKLFTYRKRKEEARKETAETKLNFLSNISKRNNKGRTDIPTNDVKSSSTDAKETISPNTTPAIDKLASTIKINSKKQNRETKLIISEITEEMTGEREKMLQDLSTLWVSAVQKSDTVYFAIMKLSNPNGEEVNKNGFKKILEPIVSAAPLVGQAFVNPALTAGSLIGSNVMGTMMNDSAKQRLVKVNDADLVILARAIDDLQETLLMNYMAYKTSLKEYEMTIQITENRKKEYEELSQKNSPYTVLANTFYTEALDNQYKARQEFLMKRVVLEQLVGADALTEIETGKKPNSEETENQEQKSEETPQDKNSETSKKPEK